MEASFLSILDRAAADPDFLRRLIADPAGTARAAGWDVATDRLTELLGVAGATDAELTQALIERLTGD